MDDRYEHTSEGLEEEIMEVLYCYFMLWTVKKNAYIIYGFTKGQAGIQKMVVWKQKVYLIGYAQFIIRMDQFYMKNSMFVIFNVKYMRRGKTVSYKQWN